MRNTNLNFQSYSHFQVIIWVGDLNALYMFRSYKKWWYKTRAKGQIETKNNKILHEQIEREFDAEASRKNTTINTA